MFFPVDLFLNDKNFLESSIGLAIGALAIWIISQSYAHKVRSSKSGESGFDWVEDRLGRPFSFFYGWCLAFGYLSIVSLNITAIPLVVRTVFGSVMTYGYMYTIGGWGVYFSDLIICSAVLFAFARINQSHHGFGGKVQVALVSILILTVLFISKETFFYDENVSVSTVNYSISALSFSNILSVIAVAPWAFVGFEAVCLVSKDSNISSKGVTITLGLSVLIGLLIYLTLNWVTARAFGYNYFSISNSNWATWDAFDKISGSFGLKLLTASVIAALLAGVNGFMLASCKIIAQLSDAKMISKTFSSSNQKHSLNFIVIISLLTSLLGRNVLVDIVETASLGIGIGFIYVCLVCFLSSESKSTSITSLIGILLSISFCLLLLVPSSPAALSTTSILYFVFWVLAGVFNWLGYSVKQEPLIVV